MNKILIISFYFPPTGLTGNIRITKFVKYFPSYNIIPYVITANENIYGSKDYSLLSDIPEIAKIYRVSSFYLMNYMKKCKFLKLNQIISFINSRLIWPDGSIFWAKEAFYKAQEIIEKENINTILTSGPPFSNHLVGLKLKNWKQDLKWIADFRDEWTTNPHTQYFFLRKIYESRLQKKVFNNSDIIICISNEMKKTFERLNTEVKDKSYVIYNGFDEEDFKNYNNLSNNSQILNIVYAGTIYKGREPTNFFKALKLIKDKDIKLTFIGSNSYFIHKGIKKYKLENKVKILKRISHSEIFQQLNHYDIFLLIAGRGEKAKKNITGKFFEYLRMKKPIFALAPVESEVAKLIRITDSGVVFDYDDIEGIKSEIEKLITLKKEGKLNMKYNFNDEEINKFDRKFLTGQLVELIK